MCSGAPKALSVCGSAYMGKMERRSNYLPNSALLFFLYSLSLRERAEGLQDLLH